MKTAIIEVDYIIKSDLIMMLEHAIEHIKDGKVIAFEVESNIGGKLKVEFTEVELENLRQ
jgi:hypothetical protein